MLQLPQVVYESYLFSNFLFIPVLTLIFALASCRRRKFSFSHPEMALFLGVGVVFLFNNLVPPYEGWQMRGVWIPRIYQPLIGVMILFIARNFSSSLNGLVIRVSIVLTCLGNAVVAFGPILDSSFASEIDYRFYKHSAPYALTTNIRLYGRRPIGFCKNDGIETE